MGRHRSDKPKTQVLTSKSRGSLLTNKAVLTSRGYVNKQTAIPVLPSSHGGLVDTTIIPPAKSTQPTVLPEDLGPPIDDPAYEPLNFDRPNEAGGTGRTQNDYLNAFSEIRWDILKVILARYALPADTACHRCRERIGRWRCRDCYLNPLECRACCREQHKHNPFHRLEKWTGEFFERAFPWEVGCRLVALHQGNLCPLLRARIVELEQQEVQADRQEQLWLCNQIPAAGQSSGNGFDVDMDTSLDDMPGLQEVEDDDDEDEEYSHADEDPPAPVFGPPAEADPAGDDLPDMVDAPDSDDEDDVDINISESARRSHPAAPVLEDPDEDDDWNEPETMEADNLGDGVPREDREGNKFVTVVDRSGVHHLPLLTCTCSSTKPVEDCVFMGLFPASFKEIRTVFTFACLDDFRMANLEAKTTPYQYYQTLRRKTNPAFPASVPNRYAELRRTSRQWRLLKKLKIHGAGHEGRMPGKGGLALFCAACPQPGVNLPADWESSPTPEVYTRFLAADGNFTADHLRQKRPEDDVWLLDGQGMLTAQAPYQAHLKVAKEKYTDAPCERNFRAVGLANLASTSCDVTGIAAIACARHGCFAPGATVDLQKGERQMNVDYALCESLKTTNVTGLKKVLLIYDIMCQYRVHLGERIDRNDHLELPDGLTIDGAIGLFHVHGHRDECLFRFATYFVKHAGIVDGEILESLWSVLNLISRSTRSATLAHRAEILDDHMNDSNFKKLVNIVAVICKRYKQAVASSAHAVTYFSEMTAAADQSAIKSWTDEIERAEEVHSSEPDAMDIMNTRGMKIPTQADVQVDMIDKAAPGTTADVAWLVTGLGLQEDQLALESFIYRLGRYPTKAEKLETAGRRDRLRARLDKFQADGARRMDDRSFQHLAKDRTEVPLYEYDPDNVFPDAPAESADGAEPGPASASPPLAPFRSPAGSLPERLAIPLPSALIAGRSADFALHSLANKELQLRRGQAHDALSAIRLAIGEKAFHFTKTFREASRKAMVTRSRSAVVNLTHQIAHHRRVYNLARSALIALGIPAIELVQTFKVLEDADLKTSTAVVDPNEPGLSRTQLSWIWRVNQGNLSGAAYLAEFYRVHWLRARAQAHRWAEEKNIVSHEMEWTCRFFLNRIQAWKVFQSLSPEPGFVAYARQQQAMWTSMLDNARLSFLKTNRNFKLIM